jgi:hypothetical protein
MFILFFLYIALTLEFCPFFWEILDSGVFDRPSFFYVSFLVLFFTNYSVVQLKESFNNNKDILSKFTAACSKSLSIFYTLIISRFKQLYYFLIKFEYRSSIKTVYI